MLTTLGSALNSGGSVMHDDVEEGEDIWNTNGRCIELTFLAHLYPLCKSFSRYLIHVHLHFRLFAIGLA